MGSLMLNKNIDPNSLRITIDVLNYLCENPDEVIGITYLDTHSNDNITDKTSRVVFLYNLLSELKSQNKVTKEACVDKINNEYHIIYFKKAKDIVNPELLLKFSLLLEEFQKTQDFEILQTEIQKLFSLKDTNVLKERYESNDIFN